MANLLIMCACSVLLCTLCMVNMYKDCAKGKPAEKSDQQTDTQQSERAKCRVRRQGRPFSSTGGAVSSPSTAAGSFTTTTSTRSSPSLPLPPYSTWLFLSESVSLLLCLVNLKAIQSYSYWRAQNSATNKKNESGWC
ncbi:hypothetical protein B0O80DRAFT_465790 [Mortierella sp. GBAus27b]|nr:hypothetical protein B0O80DRAFT_465790 [Mortierella sp. GBAus27b]